MRRPLCCRVSGESFTFFLRVVLELVTLTAQYLQAEVSGSKLSWIQLFKGLERSIMAALSSCGFNLKHTNLQHDGSRTPYDAQSRLFHSMAVFLAWHRVL